MGRIFEVLDDPIAVSLLWTKLDGIQKTIELFLNCEPHIQRVTTKLIFYIEVWKLKSKYYEV